jgi:hypothetical protein
MRDERGSQPQFEHLTDIPVRRPVALGADSGRDPGGAAYIVVISVAAAVGAVVAAAGF